MFHLKVVLFVVPIYIKLANKIKHSKIFDREKLCFLVMRFEEGYLKF